MTRSIGRLLVLAGAVTVFGCGELELVRRTPDVPEQRRDLEPLRLETQPTPPARETPALTEGQRELTLQVSGAEQVVPGDRVDLLAVLPDSDSPPAVTYAIGESLEVLAVGEAFGTGPRKDNRVVRPLVLRASVAQARDIVLASALGPVSVAIRNEADEGTYKSRRATRLHVAEGELWSGARRLPGCTLLIRGTAVDKSNGLKLEQ